MKRNLLGRGIFILITIIVPIILIIPPSKKINLGLDLQGGMHLVLQVQTEDALRAETESDMQRLVELAKGESVSGLTARRAGNSSFEIVGASPDGRSKLRTLADKSLPNYDYAEEGERAVFRMKAPVAAEIERLAVVQAKQTIDNRINEFGVTEPVIQTSGTRIIMQLPGVDDQERVRRLIKNTAFLEFRIVRYPPSGGGVPTKEEILAHFNGHLPEGLEILDGDAPHQRGQVAQPVGKVYYAVDKVRTVTGRDLKTARAGQGQLGDPIVLFSLTPTGSEAFGKLTGENVGKGLAIVLDGRVMSAPVINSQIRDSGQIEGRFTREEVDDLSMVLRSGALPAGITYLEERTVGPSLGRDSIRDGIRSGIIGAVLVMLYMLVIYNLSGLNAVLALILNILILFGGMAAMHSTLTLPGIAGIILTIGMAVDANVLIFERIREELRAGRTVRSAIDQGFDKAFSSIIDTHLTTLISALFLFQFGTGPVRGFAVTLSIGLLASLYTAVFVSRWLFDFVLSRRRVQKLSI
jgi:preprotein translocase subunit SecD